MAPESKEQMDPEIKAMSDIAAALETLKEPDAVGRVLQWAMKRFNVATTKGGGGTGGAQDADPTIVYANFHDLFETTTATTATQNALVGAYWFQVCEKKEGFDGQQLNTELKNLGRPSKNITRDLDFLIKTRNVMQVRKSGSSKQARKIYKLTREGIKEAEKLIRGDVE